MKYQKQYFLKYKHGFMKMVLIDALHSTPPQSDLQTGKIVDRVSRKANCNVIISAISRSKADLNRTPKNSGNPKAVSVYRNTIKNILSNSNLFDSDIRLTNPFLHISIHGMKDSHFYDVEVGTLNGKSCSKEIQITGILY